MNDTRKIINTSAIRRHEIHQAIQENPGMEIGAAYRKWKEARGEVATILLSTDIINQNNKIANMTDQLRMRPCTRDSCAGTQLLETICSGCVEGQAGYKTKWTCQLCMHRDLSREDMNEWIIRLSSF